MYLGAATSAAANSAVDPYFADKAEEMATNPTVVEIGFPPVRVTIPVTSQERSMEAWAWGIGMAVAAGGLLYFGGTFIGDVVKTIRG